VAIRRQVGLQERDPTSREWLWNRRADTVSATEYQAKHDRKACQQQKEDGSCKNVVHKNLTTLELGSG
jgi:hypothetical protein